jgi:hypothetical protein
MSDQNKRVLNIIQLTFTAIIGVSFLIGMLPAFYYYIFYITIPLAIANLVFSILKNDENVGYSIINVVMSVLAFIPILGWIAEIIGITVSILSIQSLSKVLNPEPTTENTNPQTVDATEVKETKKEHHSQKSNEKEESEKKQHSPVEKLQE